MSNQADLEKRIAVLEQKINSLTPKDWPAYARKLGEGIPPFVSHALDNFRIGNNLILTQSGLSAATTFSVANPASGNTDTIPTLTSTSTMTNKSHDSTINFTGTAASATAGGATAVAPQGFILCNVAGTARKLAYYVT
jgi:hypothetical protein